VLTAHCIHNNLRDTIEDIGFLNPAGDEGYLIGNPGRGQTSIQFPTGRTPLGQPTPLAVRKYDALELGLRNYFDAKYVEAETNLRTAYGKGSGLAAYYLARMYRDGQGVKADDARALEWALKGADRGNALAQNVAGLLYSAGRGTKKENAAGSPGKLAHQPRSAFCPKTTN